MCGPWHRKFLVVLRWAAVSWIPQAEEILAPWGRDGAEVNAEPGRGHNVYLFPTRYACHHG